MSPADTLFIFLAFVLRVHDEHVRAADKLDEPGVLLLGEFQRLCIGGARPGLHAVKRFVVRNEHDGPGAGVQPVTDADAGMIHEHGLHLHLPDAEFHVA